MILYSDAVDGINQCETSLNQTNNQISNRVTNDCDTSDGQQQYTNDSDMNKTNETYETPSDLPAQAYAKALYPFKGKLVVPL